MRLGFNTIYTNIGWHNLQVQNEYSDVISQINTGKIMQYGYQNSSAYIQNLQLEYDIITNKQGLDTAKYAQSSTLNTDKAMSDLVSLVEKFKTKMIQATNDSNSQTSLDAIASELTAIKKNIIEIANTRIDGKYIFGGSVNNVAPIDANGVYQGNNSKLQALTSSNNVLDFNITGFELFFGQDSNAKRTIATNIPKYNQSLQHPNTMNPISTGAVSKDVFITESDTLRNLIGDTDGNTTNDLPEVFYIQGRKPDGTPFKDKFTLNTAYTNEQNATKVQDLLDRIGTSFGNTVNNKIVDVTLNDSGQIMISDIKNGRSGIEFHMISSDTDVNNIDDLLTNGNRVTSYVQSSFEQIPTASQTTSIPNRFDHRINEIGTTLRTQDNAVAKTNNLLSDIFGPNVDSINFSGTAANTAIGVAGAAIVPFNFPITATSTVQDLMDAVDAQFGAGNMEVQLENGKLLFIDNNVERRTDAGITTYFGTSSLSVTMETLDALGAPINAISNDYSVEYSRTYFEKNGSTVSGNTPQIVRSTNAVATNASTIASVSNVLMNNEVYNMNLRDVNGVEINVAVNFLDAGSTFTITDTATPPNVFTIPLFEATSNNSTAADSVTYKQLSDAMQIALNYSNTTPAQLTAAATNTAAGKTAYNTLVTTSSSFVNVGLDYRGVIQATDVNTSPSRMEISIYDANTNDFNPATINNVSPALSFNANSALTLTDPHINFFTQIDEMIESVRLGNHRGGMVDGNPYNSTMRNVGTQGGLARLDVFADNFNKLHAENGSQGQNFEYVISRHELLNVQIQSIQNEVIGTDVASAATRLQQITLNMQAIYSTTAKVSQLSLLQYI